MVDTGKVGSVGKVNCQTNDHAWTFLRKYKGTKFTHGLWHTWDRPKDEVLLSKIVSLAIKTLRIRVLERGVWTHGAEMASTETGSAAVCGSKKLRTERAVTNYRRPCNTCTELVYTGEIVPGWNEDFTALWEEAMAQEKHTACVSSSALVECGTNPSGAAADKGLSCVKASQGVCAIWRETTTGRSCPCKNLLTATNTFLCEDDGATNMYTCNNNGNHEPQQIDYILSSDTRPRSRTFDSSATDSDHWGLIAAVKSKETNWMGMSGSHRFQQRSACLFNCG